MPFGIGKRSCVGEAFAKSRLFLFITTLIQRFHFTQDYSRTPWSCDPRSFRPGIVLFPHKYWVKVIPRMWQRHWRNAERLNECGRTPRRQTFQPYRGEIVQQHHRDTFDPVVRNIWKGTAVNCVSWKRVPGNISIYCASCATVLGKNPNRLLLLDVLLKIWPICILSIMICSKY